ncbi:hypothetical protein N7478_002211 [Penicillium angulare]|uniref:uncharacterized protein n=1 Tax=Penicillium angulare TaxID=116970 RepID=UPI002540F681|nr:uncharacterized protein N7478_002211 [Penicillium angulare]KAJ5289181.1 hypothetical protein N7478_002211 [Penicillium angulare]
MSDVDAFRDAEHIADVSGLSFNDDEDSDASIGAGPLSAQDRTRVRKAQSTAKIASIDRLLRDLDILIYCELSALYYMDCSVMLFALRAIVELIFFTPKAPPFDPTRNQPFVSAIIASNLFCMFVHAFIIQPEGTEATRGYLHGGLFIDFIGQLPVSTFRLLAFDILIFLVDFIMLGLIIERVKTAAIISPPTPPTTTPSTNANTDSTNTDPNPNTNTNGETTQTDTNTNTNNEGQDHDAEERGIVRGTEEPETSNSPTSTTPPVISIDDDDINDERVSLLADPGDSTSGRDNHPLDSFASGLAVIMDMGIFSTIRDQWAYSTTPQRPTGYSPSPETATFLRQRFGLQVGANGRFVRVNQ